MSSGHKVPIESQIAEVQREIALRGNVYPGLVGRGKMRQAEADLCLKRMRAVLETLKWCQAHEPEIREYIRAKRGDAG
jgi:ABC-type nitrate/sulfonate/bicarbonate transport system substrate-binding protein